MNQTFKSGHVYKRVNSTDDLIYLCVPMTSIGQLVEFRKSNETVYYEPTENKYFLNTYRRQDNSLKSILTDPSNYEVIGTVYHNYKLYDDNTLELLK